MVKIEKILYPCDLTLHSSKILNYVLSISAKYDAVVYLLHVVQDLIQWGGWYVPHRSLHLEQEQVLENAAKILERFCAKHLKSCPNFQKRIVSGDPTMEILKTIASEGIDLVVMGTHGRKGLEYTLFGSVAAKVVRKSPVPVLTINPDTLK
jgi:nucleotide-binding universal stress UspA family protein